MPPRKAASPNPALCAPDLADFAIRVSCSHDGGRISDGDIAFISQAAEINPGDYTVVRWPKGEHSIYRVFDVGGERVFISTCDDTDFAPVFADNLPFEILGKIVGVQFGTHSNTN